ncbi:MAG TPA: VanW family protein [Candidatus Acidoferrum sp.]|nr:VanW family protein [Candidatus Acidoferrum sp.]
MKCILIRSVKNLLSGQRIARTRQSDPLPFELYAHKSLIRRKLGNVAPELQENKAVNLGIAAPKVTGILIRPGEVFSFWSLVGATSERKGYQKGLVINRGKTGSGIGGGMCQFTNLIHWLVLHSPLEIVEHHHHDGIDIFPDFGRQVPFGVGTSIVYNYLDYRFKNPTEATYQLMLYTTPDYLCGELRSDARSDFSYHIKVSDEFFSQEDDGIYRNGQIIRNMIDKRSGNVVKSELIKTNHAKILYDASFVADVLR